MKGMIAQIILCIVYVLAGFLLATPYCMLAGWDEETLPMVAFTAPVFLLVWLFLALFTGVVYVGDRSKIHFNWRGAFRSGHLTSPGLLPIQLFWGWALYSLLPIIFHWSAALLEKVGFNTAASFIETNRYASQLYVFAAALAVLIIAIIVGSAWNMAKKGWMKIKHS